MSGLLEPGSHRAEGLDDEGLWRAMAEVELAWLRALAEYGVADGRQVRALEDGIAGGVPRPAAGAIESSGNPVVELVRILRETVDEDTARLVHRGLTSQDVIDTALMMLARDALQRVDGSLGATASALADLAAAHRGSVMAGRTLTQYAVPVTFGLKAAQWLVGVLDARAGVRACQIPVEVGGAAGTRSLLGELTGSPDAVVDRLAAELGLASPELPWHTRRTPVTRVASALVEACDAAGTIAGNVLLLGRPEIGEVREGRAAGRGGSSTMPHKTNPVLSVLIRSAALQAPPLLAQLHTSSALAVDERSDGPWHAEWPAFGRLLRLGTTALSQTAELVAGLEVDVDAMARNARGAADDLLAERGTGDELESYLGSSTLFVDRAVARWERDRA